jgi:hypothetical protein
VKANPLMLPHITCACGASTGQEPSYEKALEMYRAHECPSPGLCAICTGETEPVREQRLDGKDILVCRRCEFEHPRGGSYSFEGGRPDPRAAGPVRASTAFRKSSGA